MDRDMSEPTETVWSRPWLRRADQLTVGVLVAIGFCAVLCHWTWHLLSGDALIEIDRAPPLQLSYQVNVNEADWPELTLLPKIGETLARRIVEHRETHGPFRSVDELQRVKGIGPKTLRQIAGHVCVE